MRSLHTQPCPVCGLRYRRSNEDSCTKCHLASGGKLCQCGAHIERTDSVCRGCWTSQARNQPQKVHGNATVGLTGAFRGAVHSDVSSVNLSTYRMETTQVESASIEHDGDWSYLLSPEVKERYDAWRAGNPRRHGNARD